MQRLHHTPPLRCFGGERGPSEMGRALLLFLLSLASLLLLSSSEHTLFQDVNPENPIVHFVLSPRAGELCERVCVTGLSRTNLKSYASLVRVTLKIPESVPERLHGKVEVCFHRNASIGLCQCEKEEWQTLQKGQWSAAISPYENRYIDVKFKDKTLNSFTVSIEEEFQQWRLVCLGFGVSLLLLAPVISNWVPFYYSSSMALGVLLVILLILFQGMKMLPMGRKNILYLTIYGSVLGVGSFIAHYFSTVVNSVLVSFGLSEEMHNPVSVFLLVGIILAGAALGYWIVRKFVLAEDGRIDAGIAQFVKWAMRVIAMVFVSQSTLDPFLALITLAVCWGICLLIASKKRRSPATLQQMPHRNGNLWQRKARQTSAINRQAEFLSRSSENDFGRNVGGGADRQYPNDFGRNVWGGADRQYPLSRSPIKGSSEKDSGRNVGAGVDSPYALSRSPIKGQAQFPIKKRIGCQYDDYYSTYHKIPPRKFSKKEWQDFTRESTREALTDWASSPEVARWLADNAYRIRLGPESSSDDMGSSSGSSEETEVENGSGLNLFKWY